MFIKKSSFVKCITSEDGDIRKAISTIEKGGLRIALIIDKDKKLVGTICDGDIRRGLLKGFTLDSPLSNIVKRNYHKAGPNVSKKEVSKIMKENSISQIPIVTNDNQLIGLEISQDLIPDSSNFLNPNYALLMAGGKGTRLQPLTNNCPKPLLPINGKPILEIILEQCINSGIRNFYISVHYLAEKIIKYFGDGSKWNVNIEYLSENIPLGTAGALKLLPNKIKDPIVLINGDVLTKINFHEILKYHTENNADITICAREHKLSSPYGVIEVQGIKFKSMIEKPSFRQLVNAGVYIINPNLIKQIKTNQYIDMPEFIEGTKNRNKNIIVYPVHEYWIDIGKPESLNKAYFEWSDESLSKLKE